MRVAILGGKLQGLEVAYLAGKAGFETFLIDKVGGTPAEGLCDETLIFEFSHHHHTPSVPGLPIDLIIPAFENIEALESAALWAAESNIPYLFDRYAYGISSSKLLSDALFARMNLPAPLTFPECGFPVVVKPDGESGSKGVQVLQNEEELALCLERCGQPVVVQGYLDGPSFSIEVLGVPGQYQLGQITDLHMDDLHDCRMVTAPTSLSVHHVDEFEQLAGKLAWELQLFGIMDVEVILHQGKLKLLEIDARFPSQTPLTVYWSTGFNMVEYLARQLTGAAMTNDGYSTERYVIVEHIHVLDGKIHHCGEGRIAGHGPLKVMPSLFNADEGITSFVSGAEDWVATLIYSGKTRRETEDKRAGCYMKIRKALQGGRER